MSRQMDDDIEEQSSPDSSFLSRQSPLGPNEQANEDGQILWSSYRKNSPSPEADRDSDASEVTSDGSVQWEKNFIDKLVKVKKYSCRQERTAPTSEAAKSSIEKAVLQVSDELNRDVDQHNAPEGGVLPLNEQLPECSTSCHVSSSCDKRQLQGTNELRQDFETRDHTSGEVNLGYVSRWMKGPPGSPSHCEVSSSSCDSESDDDHDQRGETENEATLQQEESYSDLIVTGPSEREKMDECPRNCQVSSSCDSDSDGSGYSNLCLRVSEDSMEDETDHSTSKEKINASHKTSADRDDACVNETHTLLKSVESVQCEACDEAPSRTPPLSSHVKKKRSFSHTRQLASNSELDSKWTRDIGPPARLRSQSPTDSVARWRRSQSPLEPCRRLRSRSVVPIRDAQRVTRRKRRSKSCETVSNHKSRQPFKGMKSVSELPLNNGVKRRSRSRRRRWSKSVNLPGRHKSREVLSVETAARCSFCNDSHKLEEKHSVLARKCAVVGKNRVNHTYLSKTLNVSVEQLTPRMQRSLSRSRSISNTAQQESLAESSPTELRHSVPEVQVHSSEKEESLEGGKERTTRQSMFANTPNRNYRTSKKQDSPKEYTTRRSDSVIKNTPRIFAQLHDFQKPSHEQEVFRNSPGKKFLVPVSQDKNTANFSKNRQLPSEQESTIFYSATENAFGRNTNSHCSQEGWSTCRSKHSAPVNKQTRESRLNKFLEIKDQPTFNNTHTFLMKSGKEVLLSKGEKLSDDHLISGSIAKRCTRSKKNQELAGNTLNTENFKGFPEEQVSRNMNLSLPAIASESCDYPISTERLRQVYSTFKTRQSGSVLACGTLSLWSTDKTASELLDSSSDNKHLLHFHRKRKLSGSSGKETESYITEGSSIEKYPSHNRLSLLRTTSAACENRADNSNSHLQFGHSSAVNEPAAGNKTPYPPSKGKCRESSKTRLPFKSASAVYEATSDSATGECSSQEIGCKEGNAVPGTNIGCTKPCSVVLQNFLISSVSDKFVFPPFPKIGKFMKVTDFCLPQDYMNTTDNKASELITDL